MTDPGLWRQSLREHRYTEAAARARMTDTPASLIAALDDLAEIERRLRARAYPGAKRALTRYEQTLRDITDERDPEVALWLAGHVDPAAIRSGIDALEDAETQRPATHEDLSAMLHPALAHPLTAADAHNALGVRHALNAETHEAGSEFQRALDLDPQHYRALTNLGNLLLEQGDPAAAEERYRTALKINPDYSGAHHNLAVALRRQRKLAASVRSLKTSQRLSVKQVNEEGKAEAREKLGQMTSPQGGRLMRIVLIVLVVLLALWLLRALGG